MPDREGLQREVINLVPSIITGVAYRYIKLKYLVKNIDAKNVLDGVNALSAIGSKKAGGRYNIPDKFPKESFEALYLADTSENALKEVEDKVSGIPIFPLRVMLSKFR